MIHINTMTEPVNEATVLTKNRRCQVFMNSFQTEKIIDLMARESDMTIATISHDGHPLASTVSYANDGMVLYFGTSSQSQKAGNIEKDGRVALTINRPYRFWRDIEGLSITGKASIVTMPDEFRRANQLVFEKFPQVHDFATTESSEVVLIKVQPLTISYLNYRKGVGHKEELTMEPL